MEQVEQVLKYSSVSDFVRYTEPQESAQGHLDQDTSGLGNVKCSCQKRRANVQQLWSKGKILLPFVDALKTFNMDRVSDINFCLALQSNEECRQLSVSMRRKMSGHLR